jgi:hypothetical protein
MTGNGRKWRTAGYSLDLREGFKSCQSPHLEIVSDDPVGIHAFVEFAVIHGKASVN